MIQYVYDYIFVYFIAARCGYDLSCKYKLILGSKCIRKLFCYILLIIVIDYLNETYTPSTETF